MSEQVIEELAYKQKVFAGKSQTIIEGKVVLNNNDLKKVEKTFCTAYAASCEAEKGVVKISGKANFVVIYETTEGEIKSANYNTEFATKVESDKVNAGDFCIVDVKVVETDITSISSGEVKIAAVIDAYASVVTNKTINYVSESDECVCKKTTETVNFLSDVSKHTLKTTFDIETKDQISEVLLASVGALPCKVVAAGANVRLDAEMSANVVYTAGEFPFIKTLSECVTISEEIDRAVSENQIVEAKIDVGQVTTSVSEGVITVVAELVVTLCVYNQAQITTVVDAFSTLNDVSLTISDVSLNQACAPQLLDEKISASAEVNTDTMQIDKVVGSSLKNLVLTNVYPGEETLTVEGLATITVFMEVTMDETKSVSSIDVEVPFSIKNNLDGATKDSTVDVSVVLCDIYAKHKRTNEIEVYGIIKIYANIQNSQQVVVVTNLVVGEPKLANLNSISFIITNTAQEVFELAKNLNVTEEQLLSQNPELKAILEQTNVVPENTEIIVYRRKA